MSRRGSLVLATALLGLPCSAAAAEYRPHDTINVLIVSDGVNPHGLPDDAITQPGELEAALLNPTLDWGLHLGSVDEVSSACVDEGLSLLASGTIDVVIYFAHRAARTCDGRSVQALLTAHMETHLQEHGGVVVFHHGVFQASGKNQILELLGGTAGRFEWYPDDGQTVINVAPEHFITTHGLSYDEATVFEASGLDVAAATYPSFTNVPDERYPELRALTEPGETRVPLFASDYDGPQLLGYDLHRPDWKGHVVMYQPGEYQPHALGEGRNRQILSNAIYFAATELEGEPKEPRKPREPREPETTGDPNFEPSTGSESTETAGEGTGLEETGSTTASRPGKGSSTGAGGSTSSDSGFPGGPDHIHPPAPERPEPPGSVPTAHPRADAPLPTPAVASCRVGREGNGRGGGVWALWILLGLLAPRRRMHGPTE